MQEPWRGREVGARARPRQGSCMTADGARQRWQPRSCALSSLLCLPWAGGGANSLRPSALDGEAGAPVACGVV
eukprot:1681106-Pyramimonas_sp.AAC.1